MSDQKRSLSAALNLTPEVKSFIDGKIESTDSKPNNSIEHEKADSKPSGLQVTKAILTKNKMPKQTKSRTTKQPLQDQPASILEARVAVTTRFRQSTAEKLRRFSLERKLRGERPWSQQEIIESALNYWIQTDSES